MTALGGGLIALMVVASLPVDREALSGAIAGRVCRDLNRDGRCAADEPGYPRVRLVLETGHEVVSDEQGRYHFAAVSSRIPDTLGGVRLQPGRHRIRADDRGLLPGTTVVPRAVTVEVPMVGLVRQDFAVQEAEVSTGEVAPAWREAPPRAQVGEAGAIQFVLTGRAPRGAQVVIAGVAADVDEGGIYRASVPLNPGTNTVDLRVETDDGAVQLLEQRVDVIQREGGALVVPRTPRPTAQVRLPGTPDAPARAGAGRLRVEARPGTVITHPGGELRVGSEGAVDVPILLEVGRNRIPLAVRPPDEAVQEVTLDIDARPGALVVGLVDLEATFRPGGGGLLEAGRLYGRGAAHADVPLGRWRLRGEIDLRDQDVEDVRAQGASVLVTPRRPFELERALDPDRLPSEFGDDSAAIVPNVTDARVRLEVAHPDFGRFGFGTLRAQFSDSEVGRYHRELFGPWARLHTSEEGTFGAGVEAFASAGAVDPTTGLTTRPAHAEFLPTGGSLFYLPHGSIVRGSDQVRIVVREGLTGVPIGERHLVRGVDYDLDAESGRLILAEPLSFAVARPFFASDPMTSGAEPVLVVDYERLVLGGGGRGAVGGELSGRAGPVRLSGGAVQEEGGAYRLLRGTAAAEVGPLLLTVEAAQSRGRAHAAGDVSLSATGGLEFDMPDFSGDAARTPDGWALGVRLRGPTLAGGRIDAAWRRRTPDFSDAVWDGRGPLTELTLFAEQPLGPVRLGVLGDERTLVDPRDPFGDEEIAARTLGGYAAVGGQTWEARVEAKDQTLTEGVRLDESLQVHGGRTSVGLVGRLRVHERLWLQAGHRHLVSTRGDGPGTFDDTFTSAGAELALDDRDRIGLFGGWGPRLGPVVWTQGQIARGPDTYYGSYSVDVDAPDWGERRAVTGARTVLGDGTAVFVEDVGAHDADSVRMARAVGLTQTLAPGLLVSARYERGVRSPIDAGSPLRRDAGGVSASWVRERVRLHGRLETRFERGAGLDRVQRLATGAASVDVLPNLRLSGRLHYGDTLDRTRPFQTRTRLLEGYAGLAWRLEGFMLLVHYGIEREISPVRPSSGERKLERLSVMPSVKFGDRVALAAGGHVGWSTVIGRTATVLSASVRPSVRVVGGLEVAAEVARRSAAPDGGEFNALRGEIGYRFQQDLLMAAGYTFFGYPGLGLSPGREQTQRLYLRAEAAW